MEHPRPVALVVPSYKRPTALRSLDQYYEDAVFDYMSACCSGAMYDLPAAWDHIEHYPWRQVNVGASRNAAMAPAYAELGEEGIYYQTDDDIQLPWAGVLEVVREMHKHPEYGIVGATGPGMWANKTLRKQAPGSVMDANTPFRCVFISGAVVRDIGFHNPEYVFCEDTEYTMRAACAGYEVVFMRVANEFMFDEALSTGGGGTETEPHSLDRHVIKFKWSRRMVKEFPWTDTSVDGSFLWKGAFKKLTAEEKVEYARYIGPHIVEGRE